MSSLLVGLLWLTAIYLVAVGGCTVQYVVKTFFPSERVVAYTAKKPAVIDRENPAPESSNKSTDPQEIKDRMLAAIVLHGTQGWFFKVSGPLEAVAKHAETIKSFLESVHFDGPESPPHWKLPEGWEQQPGNEMRFATLQIGGGEEPLALAVSTLPNNEPSDTTYLLANVNRWRGQMGLPSLAAKDLAKELKEFKIEGARAYLVDISGKLTAGGMGRGPFSGGGPIAGGNLPDEPAKHEAGPASGEGPIKFKAPQGWSQGKVGGMRKAAFMVEDGKESAEITIIDLPAAANNPLDNVNRWRKQVGLEDISAAELQKTAKKINVAGQPALYVQLVGPAEPAPRKTMLGVMAVVGEQAWFIKLVGDAELAEREQANFEAFVSSIQFSER